MTVAPTLGLALIARDEADQLPRLLASIEGAFDQVVLLDTGSTDDTVAVFEKWAECQQLPLGYKVDHFDWCDDFAAARNAADALLDTDWLSWADCDDWVIGADRLREVVAMARSEKIKVYSFDYERLTVSHGLNMRYRLLRQGVARWQGRVHEGHDLFGLESKDEIGHLPKDQISTIKWVTDRGSGRPSSLQRNAVILRRWAVDEPDNPLPLQLLAPLELHHGDIEMGLRLFERLLEVPGGDRSPQEATLARWALIDLRRLLDGGLQSLDHEIQQVVIGPTPPFLSESLPTSG